NKYRTITMSKNILYLFLVACVFSSCRTDSTENDTTALDSLYIEKLIKEAPALSPEEAIRTMLVEDGFEVKLVAAEPLVSSPVAMTFDNQGRIWVAEMEGYMPNADGSGEEV